MHLVVLHLKKKDEIKIEVLFAPSTMHHIQGQGRKEVEDDRKKKKETGSRNFEIKKQTSAIYFCHASETETLP